MKIATLLFIALLSISSFGFSQSVTIGTQTWTTLNLDVATFRNGDAIPQAKTNEEWLTAGINEQPAWCYYDNDPKNGTKYGKLYNWYAVNDERGLAPVGWHVPTYQEWTTLEENIGDNVGKKMKSRMGWINNGNGDNGSGFNAVPGGSGGGNFFYEAGELGYWWSCTEVVTNDGIDASYRSLGWKGDEFLNIDYSVKSSGKSVRCVRD
jgi:uncharacterized protein (TIGR02145 family)